jgi:hypothetical protein
MQESHMHTGSMLAAYVGEGRVVDGASIVLR